MITCRGSQIPPFLALTVETRYAGLAVAAFAEGDRAPALAEYLDRLPTRLTLALVHARDTHRWAPCSKCGEGTLIPAAVGSRGGLTPAKVEDGPVCRFSRQTETVGSLTTSVRCPGHHFPLEGPWLRLHPLGWETADSLPW
jgi:hypothetical protein